MLLKVFSLFLTTFILGAVVAKNVVDVNPAPVKDSFDVIDHRNMTLEEQLVMVGHAEQARTLHGTDSSKILAYVYDEFRRLYGNDANCFANIGEINGIFWTNPYFIYLKSDNRKWNMHIVCYKARFDDCSGDQHKIVLLIN